jgi:hemerythrin-like domain-containing protein
VIRPQTVGAPPDFLAEFQAWARAAENDASVPSAQHPVDELLAEHHLIRKVLEAVQKEGGKIRQKKHLDLDFWEGAVEIIGNFGLLFHYAKKANHLFPAIEPFGMGEKIKALDQQQQQDIDVTLELCNAVSEGDWETVQRLVSLYVGTKRDHMAREEQEVLLPAKALLSPESAAALRRTFDSLESPPGKSRKVYLDAALKVIREAGLPDPRAS